MSEVSQGAGWWKAPGHRGYAPEPHLSGDPVRESPNRTRSTRALKRGSIRALALFLTLGATILAFAGAPASAKTLPLKPLLLTVAQMPTGWTADHSTLASGCGQPKGVRVTQSVTASYGDGAMGQVVEQLKTYSVAVETAYRRVLASLNRCKYERVTGPTGKTLNASFGQMSLPRVGNQSEAFDAQVIHKGQTTTNVYEVVIRSGNIIVTLTERGGGGGSIPQFQTITSEALLKLPFGGTPPIAVAVPKTTTAPATTTTTTTSPPATTTTTTRPPPLVTTTTNVPVPVTAAPVSCTPISDENTCYEPGEYCREDDHGVTGKAGDGETITCEDNDGWRWEPT